MCVISLLMVEKVMETASLTFIWNWKKNIKRDVNEYNKEAAQFKSKNKNKQNANKFTTSLGGRNNAGENTPLLMPGNQ